MGKTLEQKVEDIRAKQDEISSTLLAVKGQDYHDAVILLSGIILLGRALASVGYVLCAEDLARHALSSAFTSLGVSADSDLGLEMAKDAVVLAEISSVPAA